MLFIGFGIVWGGYVLTYAGYCWVKGYDISFMEIVSPRNYYQGSWPPPKASDSEVIPSSKGAKAPVNKNTAG